MPVKGLASKRKYINLKIIYVYEINYFVFFHSGVCGNGAGLSASHYQ